MNENAQQITQQVAQMLQAAQQGDQEAAEAFGQFLEAVQNGDQQATLILQVIQQAAQQGDEAAQYIIQTLSGDNGQQGAAMARHGAKLSYIRRLRGECPEGTEMIVFKAGGRVCKKCIGKNVDGGPVGETKSVKKKDTRKPTENAVKVETRSKVRTEARSEAKEKAVEEAKAKKNTTTSSTARKNFEKNSKSELTTDKARRKTVYSTDEKGNATKTTTREQGLKQHGNYDYMEEKVTSYKDPRMSNDTTYTHVTSNKGFGHKEKASTNNGKRPDKSFGDYVPFIEGRQEKYDRLKKEAHEKDTKLVKSKKEACGGRMKKHYFGGWFD